MPVKLTRILGIVGGALTLLPWVIFIGQSIYTFALPDSEVHFEAKPFAFIVLVLGIIFCAIAVMGFIGSLLVAKKHTVAGALMLTSGFLNLFTLPMSANVFDGLLYIPFIGYVILIPPVLLIVAGLLSFVCKPAKPQAEQLDSETP